MFYIAMVLADLTALTAVVLIYLSSYKPKYFEEFCDLAEMGHKNPADRNRRKQPWYKPERLVRCIILFLGMFGLGYISYGITKHLFVWLPFVESISDDSENPGVLCILTLCVVMGLMAFFSHVHKLALRAQD